MAFSSNQYASLSCAMLINCVALDTDYHYAWKKSTDSSLVNFRSLFSIPLVPSSSTSWVKDMGGLVCVVGRWVGG